MIDKDKLKGKYVTYLDKNGKYRTHKVVRVTGRTLTVKDVLDVKHRIHPNKFKIFGVQRKKEIEGIVW
jgi:hypothetical protein